MKIELHHIKVADLIEGYTDNDEDGVTGFGGRLDIRPKFQREFVYKEAQRNAVIDTISKGFPLNIMYWVRKADGNFEVLDGQQRTVSICKFAAGEFSVNWNGTLRYFDILLPEQREAFLNYELLVYICDGTDEEKLEWFQVINIAGERLEAQEIRNAVYSGPWVTEAKRHFSKSGCAAKTAGEGYVSKRWIRQEGLQTALQWVCLRDGLKRPEEYMSALQNDTNCNDLWLYYLEVLNWAKATFPNHRHKELTQIDWGRMYHAFKERKDLDPKALEKRIVELLKDGEITNKPGIYWYVIDGNQQHLNLRTFDEKTATEVYEAQGHRCANPDCPHGAGHQFDFKEMEADHIVPWAKGGLTVKENCQMLCRECNRKKGAR